MDSIVGRSHRQHILAFLTVALVLLPLSSLAQQEAGILGQVTDETGAVLPGVTVTATGPALQVPSVTDVTNERASTVLRRCRSARISSNTRFPVSNGAAGAVAPHDWVSRRGWTYR